MATLTTHVLDTSRGVPAQGVTVELHTGGRHVRTLVTNQDGRIGEPLVIEPGRYELTFHVADYFRDAKVALTDPPFLEVVLIQFGIADPAAHYHVPLLLSPYGYTTYRGS
jgi:5-hydroxyisourate hydrolase